MNGEGGEERYVAGDASQKEVGTGGRMRGEEEGVGGREVKRDEHGRKREVKREGEGWLFVTASHLRRRTGQWLRFIVNSR